MVCVDQGLFWEEGHVWSRKSFLPIACWSAVSLLLVPSGIRAQTSAPEFTIEQAYAAAVSFAPADVDPNTILGRDSSGEVVWVSGPDGSWGNRNDSSGRTLESVDELGNRFLFSYDLSGRRVAVRNEYIHAGTWTERSVWDAADHPFLRAIETGPTDVARKLAVLGIAEGVTPMAEESTITEDESGTTWFFPSPFASTTIWYSANQEAVPDGVPYLRETTYALGLRMSVWREMSPEGSWVRDDHGGARLENYDTVDRLMTAEDANGLIVAAEYGAEYRPAALYIGDVALLRYTYGADGSWSKELIDRRTGEVIYSVESAAAPGRDRESVYRPRPVTHAWIPERGPVVEWDEIFPWDGHVLANLNGQPYALLPIDSEATPWRSISPWPSQERIDYSADQMIIHLVADKGPDGIPQTVAISLPRRPAPEAPAPAPDFGTPSLSSTVEFCNLDCICITRYLKAGIYVEVRCPSSVIQIIPRVPIIPGVGGPRTPGGGARNTPQGLPLTPAQKLKAAQGTNKANETLTKYRECQDLFQPYGISDGRTVLGSLVLSNGEGLRDSKDEIPCDKPNRPSAWLGMATRTGSTTRSNVHLCRRFENLTMNEAAMTLIHESLHVAGMPEYPPVPGAMTSAQINALVRQKCRL